MSKSDSTFWWTYIVECSDGTLYTGATSNLDQRISTHNSGKGAKYTRARLPVKLVFAEKKEDQSSALKRECAIKLLKRSEKKVLIEQFFHSLDVK